MIWKFKYWLYAHHGRWLLSRARQQEFCWLEKVAWTAIIDTAVDIIEQLHEEERLEEEGRRIWESLMN
jgi:hypothetical protein